MPSGHDSLSRRFPVALVTGASSGIGRAIARALLQEGVKVHGTSRRPENPALDPDIEWLAFDGATPAGIQGFLEENGDLLNKVDLLVNNAGSSCFGKASEIPSHILEEQHCLLLTAPLQLTRVALEGMQKRRAGAIVNVSSLAALFSIPYMEGYSACKAALSSYSQGLMPTLAGSGICIIDFQPGDYQTGFNEAITRWGKTCPRQERVWARLEANIAAAPPAGQAAEDLLRALRRGRSCTVKSGGFFQSRIAPLGHRILPGAVLRSLIRRYFNLGRG